MKKVFLLMLGVASLGACKKDSEPAATASRTELLTAKNWRLSAYTATSGTDKPVDGYSSIPTCIQDNFVKFKTDKSAVQDEGPTKCDPSDPQTETSSWDFADSETKLTSPELADFGSSLDIVELSATTLHLRQTSTSTGSPTQTLDVTFTAF